MKIKDKRTKVSQFKFLIIFLGDKLCFIISSLKAAKRKKPEQIKPLVRAGFSLIKDTPTRETIIKRRIIVGKKLVTLVCSSLVMGCFSLRNR
ncbi:MAG: hypothetical protein BWY48_00559 [Parcubacteria group bacterium ADurb.Bin305]|nr:MAG: hypothetical protein BWY48_00563 [Parcubacteria group bacterium ADurb.Bin305]OQA42963.1 MAG: hypothetical protein BWY48_00559 [Parcubacteria group bacterium ADurb.Bin305]